MARRERVTTKRVLRSGAREFFFFFCFYGAVVLTTTIAIT